MSTSLRIIKALTGLTALRQDFETVLPTNATLIQFDMDTKRNKETGEILKAAQAASELIHKVQPDVVITSDDNAARYLIVPFLLDTGIPVVFSGINWTVEEYGFPAENVTGIVETAPLKVLIDAAIQSVQDARRAVYLSAETLSESKNFERYRRAADDAGLELQRLKASTMKGWLNAFDESQSYDFVIMGGVGGISDWDDTTAIEHVAQNTSALVVTTHDWLMPYASLGFTLIPEEQGEWAGKAAIAILNGTSPGTIPIVTNRKWDAWINEKLIQLSDAKVPDTVIRSAKKLL